jgi:inner membrane protein
MTGPTHVAIALAAALAASAANGQPPPAPGWIALVLGSLAPDIDGQGYIARPGSLAGRLLPRWLAKVLDEIGLAISGTIRSIFGHRTITHYPIWYIWLISLSPLLPTPYSLLAFWFGFGCLFHIVGDFCTKSGVPLLGPFSSQDFSCFPLRTGSWAEGLISVALWGLIFYYGWGYVPLEVRGWLARFQ